MLMMQPMRILLALVALCRCRDLLAQELTAVTTQRSNTVKENLNITDKRLDFVNIIRDDLRRNNDDYALLERQNQPQPPYRKQMLKPGPRPQLPRQYSDTRRGQGDINESFQDGNAFKSYTHSKRHKIMRLNKLKRLLNKDKVRMRGEEQETRPPSSPPAPAHSSPAPSPESRPRFTPQRRNSPPPEDTEPQAPVPRLRSEQSQSPSPDQLDMAAARNPELTRIRLKGRLCQRSLMNLEGPTYDRQGQEVVPAFRPRLARGRQFPQTRAPDLVLPRCCNCCKKSVLGCQ